MACPRSSENRVKAALEEALRRGPTRGWRRGTLWRRGEPGGVMVPEQTPEPQQLMVSQISPRLCTLASMKPSAPAEAHKNVYTAFKQIAVHIGEAAGAWNLAKVLRPPLADTRTYSISSRINK